VNEVDPLAAALRERERRTAARGRGRWGEGLEGQRIAGHRIAVVARTRHGTRKQPFVLASKDEADPDAELCWKRVTDTVPFSVDGHRGKIPVSEQLPPTVQLAEGAALPAAMMATIFDALLSGARHQVDLADVLRVRSQIGPRILQFNTWPRGQREHAERALYAEILRRCTNL
jgi:hypothetical protein